jgi:hypothetical protein
VFLAAGLQILASLARVVKSCRTLFVLVFIYRCSTRPQPSTHKKCAAASQLCVRQKLHSSISRQRCQELRQRFGVSLLLAAAACCYDFTDLHNPPPLDIRPGDSQLLNTVLLNKALVVQGISLEHKNSVYYTQSILSNSML